MASIAGHPEYVGVISTFTVRACSSTSTSHRMPRSSIVMTGTSGSGMDAIAARRSMVAVATATVVGVVAEVTMWHLGMSCLLYTSDAADDLTRVDLGGGRIIK